MENEFRYTGLEDRDITSGRGERRLRKRGSKKFEVER